MTGARRRLPGAPPSSEGRRRRLAERAARAVRRQRERARRPSSDRSAPTSGARSIGRVSPRALPARTPTIRGDDDFPGWGATTAAVVASGRRRAPGARSRPGDLEPSSASVTVDQAVSGSPSVAVADAVSRLADDR